MKISVSRDALQEALSASNISSNGPVVLTTKGDKLEVLGSNGDLTVRVSIDAKSDEQRSVTLPGRYLQQLVSSLSSSDVTLDVSDDIVRLSGGPSAFSVRSQLAQIVEVSIPDTDPVSVTGDLLNAMSDVALAASRDQARQTLMGVLMASSETGVDLVATDSYRLAVRRMPAESIGTEANAIVPATAIAAVAKVLGKRSGVNVRIGDRSVSFEADGASVTTRLIDGNYPNYKAVIPNETTTTVTVDKDVLTSALNRARLVHDVRVTMSVADGNVTLSSLSPEGNDLSEAFEVGVEGDDVVFAVNPAYMIDGLRTLPAGDITIKLLSPSKPVRLEHPSSPDTTYIVMPVRA